MFHKQGSSRLLSRLVTVPIYSPLGIQLEYVMPEDTITDQPFCNFSLFLFSFSFLILTSLRSYRDEGYITLSLSLRFYLEKFCSVFVVIACHRFLD